MTHKSFSLCALALAVMTAGCNDTASTVVVANDYAAVTVYKAWWSTTLIADPVAPGGESAEERTVPGDEPAYALLAPGWSPESGAPPTLLIAAQSAAPLSVARGDRLEIRVSDDTFVGDCAAGRPLDAESAQLIVERIFPGDFAGVSYDPATCVATPIAIGDAGAD